MLKEEEERGKRLTPHIIRHWQWIPASAGMTAVMKRLSKILIDRPVFYNNL
jgi:hypothetical protein